jgi:hypothetical protein
MEGRTQLLQHCGGDPEYQNIPAPHESAAEKVTSGVSNMQVQRFQIPIHIG